MTDTSTAAGTGPATGQDDLESGIHGLLMSVQALKGWLREAHQWYPGDGVTGAQVGLLFLLHRVGPARVGTLAEEARLDVSVVSRQVAALEQAGLVGRTTDPSDGRVRELALTPRGAAWVVEARDAVVAKMAQRLAGWTPEELDGLASAMTRLTQDLTRTTHDQEAHP